MVAPQVIPTRLLMPRGPQSDPAPSSASSSSAPSSGDGDPVDLENLGCVDRGTSRGSERAPLDNCEDPTPVPRKIPMCGAWHRIAKLALERDTTCLFESMKRRSMLIDSLVFPRATPSASLALRQLIAAATRFGDRASAGEYSRLTRAIGGMLRLVQDKVERGERAEERAVQERDEWEKMSMDLLEELELVRCEARHAKGQALTPGPCEPWQHQCEGCQVVEARLKGEMAAMEAEVRASLEQRDEARAHLDECRVLLEVVAPQLHAARATIAEMKHANDNRDDAESVTVRKSSDEDRSPRSHVRDAATQSSTISSSSLGPISTDSAEKSQDQLAGCSIRQPEGTQSVSTLSGISPCEPEINAMSYPVSATLSVPKGAETRRFSQAQAPTDIETRISQKTSAPDYSVSRSTAFGKLGCYATPGRGIQPVLEGFVPLVAQAGGPISSNGFNAHLSSGNNGSSPPCVSPLLLQRSSGQSNTNIGPSSGAATSGSAAGFGSCAQHRPGPVVNGRRVRVSADKSDKGQFAAFEDDDDDQGCRVVIKGLKIIASSLKRRLGLGPRTDKWRRFPGNVSPSY